ncbi:hypothetical protein PV721_43765, partial [Streptomyces sp. MB09-01]|uniref:hypothetical protein n=1 Tax=Streptomyces sp. MB09-01 TaxID=3028666 RepID=UPI0029A4EC52
RVDTVPAPPTTPDPEALRGLRIGVVDDGQGLAQALSTALEAHGAEPHPLTEPEPGFDAVVDLTGLRTGSEPVLPQLFPALRRALTDGTHRLLLVTTPGAAAAGLHGFARSAALEFPGTLVRAVDVHPKEAPEQVAAQLLAELSCDTPRSSVGYTPEGSRTTRTPVPA